MTTATDVFIGHGLDSLLFIYIHSQVPSVIFYEYMTVCNYCDFSHIIVLFVCIFDKSKLANVKTLYTCTHYTLKICVIMIQRDTANSYNVCIWL